MPEQYATRIASLEAYSRMYSEDLLDIKKQIGQLREIVEEVRRDMHAAKIGGRVGLGVAAAMGGMVTWLLQHAVRGPT